MGTALWARCRILGNKVTFGGADRLSNWISGNGFNRSDYYKDKPEMKPGQPEKAAAAFSPVEQSSRATAMQSMKSEIDKAKAAPAAKAESQAVIGAVNNVNNSTTILPSRHEVRNNDVSFNRYLDRSLG
jgi:nucleoid-associated protein YgaU